MKIGVFPAEELALRGRLWEGLSSLFALEFVAQVNDIGAALIFSSSRAEAERAAAGGVPRLAFLNDKSSSTALPRSVIELTNSPLLTKCFRGRSLLHAAIERNFTLTEEGGTVLAWGGEEILWLRHGTKNDSLDLVSVEPPVVGPDKYLFQHFETDNWFQLLPLLHFLRELTEWSPPPIRACLMFDDPNLRWRSYGYIDYARLAEHAGAHNYHVSLATIPLDRWYIHPGTAALFRRNQDRLSLCAHGNNHTYFELAETSGEAQQNALAAQALRRVKDIEVASGLRISRVMTAPHGACTPAMGSALLRAGFEAACISRSSLMNRNPESIWPVSMGLRPAEFLGTGLPVMPRFHMRWDQTYVLFSAFLGQPIVPVGHHQDCADGYGLLETLADLINSTGEVEWMDMKSMARSNFLTRREGDTLHVKTYSRRIEMKVPQGIGYLRITRPWLETGIDGSGKGDEVIRVVEGETIEINSGAPETSDDRATKPAATSLWAYTRRHLCESRDRLSPLLDRLKPARNGKAR